jgi:putative transposase
MDGRGRALDNIFVERLWRSLKHEDIYLKGYSTVAELTLGLVEYFAFYNGERPHQGLKPHSRRGLCRWYYGGARIANHFDRDGNPSSPVASGQRRSAAVEAMDLA